MKQVRIAVIGYGGMGRSYVKMITGGEIRGLTLAGVCCRNLVGQNELKNQYPGVSVYRDVEETLARREEMDAVLIATPHPSHVEIGIAAAAAGLHLLVDKPVGVSTKEVKELAAAAKAKGVSLAMIFPVRNNPAYIKARELLDQGALGRLQRVVWVSNKWYRSPAYHASSTWRSSWRGEGGGLLINQCQHDLDIWQWLFGMPDSVLAVLDYGKYNDFQVDDSGDIQFYYKNGLHGTYIAASGETPGVSRLEIWGTKGRLCIEDSSRITLDENVTDTRAFAEHNKEIYGAPEHRLRELPLEECEGGIYRPIFENFTAHLLDGEPLHIGARAGLNTLMLANGAYLSSWLGRRINYPIDDALYVSLLSRKQQDEK